jgi:hypothetical protein
LPRFQLKREHVILEHASKTYLCHKLNNIIKISSSLLLKDKDTTMVQQLIRASAILFFFALCSELYADANLGSRYVINKHEVYDKKTNLTWQRCSVGQNWDAKSGCVGKVLTFTYDLAQGQGNKIWRMPTKSELVSLIDKQRKARDLIPTIDTGAFPDMDSDMPLYWSSPVAGHLEAFYVVFDDGSEGSYGFGNHSLRTIQFAVRLVRSGK